MAFVIKDFNARLRVTNESEHRIGKFGSRERSGNWITSRWIPVCGTSLPREFAIPQERTPTEDGACSKQPQCHHSVLGPITAFFEQTHDSAVAGTELMSSIKKKS
ncbi:hypothetical protein KIN20_025881 [Parelaphostrongylus tenuis]|uniref:Uncharacterized protein n=1 Tax=Parelaphostrongylus tenuis TaxID=148309 RepID=A0AAD5NB24_PARTN|nr:hypothetical protein KIN20_025881 [Parelaphostrongylus tenuis]